MSYTVSKEKFLKDRNTDRLQNKGKWVFYTGDIDGRLVEYKAFDTYVQVYRVDNIDYAGRMDETATRYKETLARPFV